MLYGSKQACACLFGQLACDITLHREGLSFSRSGWLLLFHRKEAFHSWSVVSSSCEDSE
jgi:hypothetical protein